MAMAFAYCPAPVVYAANREWDIAWLAVRNNPAQKLSRVAPEHYSYKYMAGTSSGLHEPVPAFKLPNCIQIGQVITNNSHPLEHRSF